MRRQRVAVLSDIHSNSLALTACLEDAKQAGAECYIFLGDYISGLAAPVESMDLVYEIREKYPTYCIRGNRERYMLEHLSGVNVCMPGSHTGTFLYTVQKLRQKDIAFFKSLPMSDTIEIGGIKIHIAHGTMDNDRYLFGFGDDKIDGVIAQMEGNFLLCGHSHVPYRYEAAGKTIINPGAVGLPLGMGSQAQYALLDVVDGKVESQIRRVAYNLGELIHRQFESGLVQIGRYWAISDLYGAITGIEYTRDLLGKMYSLEKKTCGVLQREDTWRSCAASLGLAYTEEEILAFLNKQK